MDVCSVDEVDVDDDDQSLCHMLCMETGLPYGLVCSVRVDWAGSVL